MREYVLSEGADDDLENIAGYTIVRWGVDQARRYASVLARHLDALAAGEVRTKPVFENWTELRVSRCEHHFVYSLDRSSGPIAVLAVFHETMDLPTRLRERLDQEGHA
jgi:plasmid stabilization system protein ParE